MKFCICVFKNAHKKKKKGGNTIQFDDDKSGRKYKDPIIERIVCENTLYPKQVLLARI